MIPIGPKLASIRVQKGMTQTQLAHRSGIPQANLSNIENGKQDFTVSTLVRICGTLGVDPSECFKKKEPFPRFRLTREWMEKISRSVFNPELKLSTDEQRLRDLLVDLIPEVRRRPISAKKAYQAWFVLREQLGGQAIKVLVEKIREKQPH